MLRRARPLLSALWGAAMLSPIRWAEICLGQAVLSSGKERIVVWSWPLPDLHPSLDPGVARKPLCRQQGDFHFLRALLQLCSSAKYF